MITPKTSHKHAVIIKLWADGAMIEYRRSVAEEWRDVTTATPIWHCQFEYRVKPAPSIYPETRMTFEQMCLVGDIPLTAVHADDLKTVANAAIVRAIDDGQVVRAGAPVSTPSGCWREDFGELSIVGPRLLVEKAFKQLRQFNSTDPNNADTSTFRWMGHTAREWQELCAIAEKKLDDSKIVDAEFDPDFQEVGDAENLRKIEELKDRLDVLPARACRALCDYLGKSRNDVSFEVIQAIILLERNKP